MVVRGRQRKRIRRKWPARLGRLVLAGVLLSLSTHELARHDAPHRIRLADAGRPAAAARPLDKTVTGSIALPDRINRSTKSDRVAAKRPPPISAGALMAASLFAPDSDQAAPRMAFVLPAVQNVAVAAQNVAVAASAPAPAPARPVPLPNAAPAAKPQQVAAMGYANTDAGEQAASKIFDAVMAKKGRGAVVLDPSIDANHAWVNYALPANVHSASEVKCLATAMYFEARGEPELGQIAVAQVVLNRLKNPAYPNTICAVVYQNKNKRNRCQFSFACDGIADRITDRKAWASSQALATKILNDDRTMFLSDVGAATHYHANYVRPRWAHAMKKVDKIGHHVFYKTRYGGWS